MPSGGRHRAEVIGFRGRHVLSMPLAATGGVQYGDAVLALGVRACDRCRASKCKAAFSTRLGSPLDAFADAACRGDVATRWFSSAAYAEGSDPRAARDGVTCPGRYC